MAPIRVLVAHSQLLLADALAESLGRRRDLHVLAARPTNAREALGTIEAEQTDIGVLDFELPGMDPLALLRAVSEQAPGRKVIYLVGFHGRRDIDRSLAAGAAGFLPGSVCVRVLVNAIRRVHAGELPVVGDEVVDRPIAANDELAAAQERLERLTPRQVEVLELLGVGATVPEISAQLGIAQGTVRAHIHDVLSRTRTRSQLEAVALARRAGFLA